MASHRCIGAPICLSSLLTRDNAEIALLAKNLRHYCSGERNAEDHVSPTATIVMEVLNCWG